MITSFIFILLIIILTQILQWIFFNLQIMPFKKCIVCDATSKGSNATFFLCTPLILSTLLRPPNDQVTPGLVSDKTLWIYSQTIIRKQLYLQSYNFKADSVLLASSQIYFQRCTYAKFTLVKTVLERGLWDGSFSVTQFQSLVWR